MLLARNIFHLFSTHHQIRISQQLVKKLHQSNIKFQQVEEVRIPVPWGHLAGKWWGPQNKRPILCLHGWQESCGSFDPLFNLLPKDVALLAIDLPGNGYSSRLPKGVYYHSMDAVILIRRIQKYFGWSKISLLGHSLGGIICIMYTMLYADDVDMLITIESLKPFSKESSIGIKSTIEGVDQFLQLELLNDVATTPPSYTYEELVNRIMINTGKSVYPKSSKYVLERIIEKSVEDPNKFYFTRDNRLKVDPLLYMRHTDILEYMKRIKCPFIIIKANKSANYFEPKKYLSDVVDLLKANNKEFEFLEIEGTHHVHINEPEKVAVIVNKFLKEYNHIDRQAGGIKDEIKIPQVI